MTLPPPTPGLLKDASLFLDFDGTLVEFADRPDAVRADPALRSLLLALHHRLDGRLAIVSGRSLDDLTALLSLESLSMAGSHGLEYRLAGRPACIPAAPDGLAEIVAQMTAFATRRGLIVERKPAGVALHYRLRPECQQEAIAFATNLADIHGFLVWQGSMVVELRAPGPDKGAILRHFMAEPTFAAGRPVAVGDDLTDEDAFAAAVALGGAAVLVGAQRETAAIYRLVGVAAVRDWLAAAR